jgi:hypothetical protein
MIAFLYSKFLSFFISIENCSTISLRTLNVVFSFFSLFILFKIFNLNKKTQDSSLLKSFNLFFFPLHFFFIFLFYTVNFFFFKKILERMLDLCVFCCMDFISQRENIFLLDLSFVGFRFSSDKQISFGLFGLQQNLY